MGKVSDRSTRPTTLVGPRRREERERIDPRGPERRGLVRLEHRRAELTRLVRPTYHRPPPFSIAGDVVHRFRAMAIVSPAGNIYYGDEEERFDELSQRYERVKADQRDSERRRRQHRRSDTQMVVDATERNSKYRQMWRERERRRKQGDASSPSAPRPETHSTTQTRQRRRRHRGRESRKRNNAKRNQRRARARQRKLAQLLDISMETELEFD
jgi:hypothetical protein